MSGVTLSGFIDLLRDNRLLEPARLEEVRALAPADARALAKTLVQRGWLTVYQANLLLQRRAADLVLGPYRVLDRLGEGAVSQVFRARHTYLGGEVALKAIRPDLPDAGDAARQFEREVEALTRMSHPNVVAALDVEEVGCWRLLALEYLKGTDLEKFVQLSGPLPVGPACDFVRQAARGLEHAYEHGMVHRDLKPANLFLTLPGEPAGDEARGRLRLPDRAAVKILDWGLALTPDQPARPDGGPPASLIGTADYLAPEQASDPDAVDIRADIYSLGCALFYLLAGRPPFPGSSLLQKVLQHQTAEPPAIEALRPDLPRTLPPVLRKMLAKRPGDRPQTPREVAAALALFCRTAPPAAPLPVRTCAMQPS